jgi:16S rRNA (uracil1498-N3)-methyltransferase
MAPTKNMDRFEWFLEKATEIGISEITPILCKHSERRQFRQDRLEKILVAAMKQSLRAYMPILHPLTTFTDWIKTGFNGTKMIGYCSQNEMQYLWDMPLTENLVMAIGPEGDFSQEEVDEAINHDFKPVSLGNSRLRTETAGVVTCAFAQILLK